MSDSDDPLTNNLFTFQNETAVSAWGPNTNASSLTGISFRNNVLSSTMQMPRNFELQRHAGSNYDQRSMHRRETSPMSTVSACDMMQRKFHNSYYQRGQSSQRSAFNGRSGSPMSAARSIDTSASVSAVDIAMAFKSMDFNKYDLRIIKDAYNKFMKQRVRKKVEKRRNRRLFLKANTRRSGGESGEQGSDSSSSSGDGSTKTSNYKENLSSCRSTRTDVSDLRRKMKKSIRDFTDNFRYKSCQSMIDGPVNFNSTQISVTSQRSMMAGPTMPSFRSRPVPANLNSMQRKLTAPVMLQKDRFESRFLLPSQRFNSTVASTIPENDVADNHTERNNIINGRNNIPKDQDSDINRNENIARNIETDSDHDEIFSDNTAEEKTTNVQRKRNADSDDDIPMSNQKRSRLASPYKNNIDAKNPIPKEPIANTYDTTKTNDFVFAKPTFPIRKSAKEKLISKSAAPLSDILEQGSVIPPVNIKKSQPVIQVEQEAEKETESDQSNVTQNTTDLSMRPSFIKRKLFTQRLEMSEKKNTSIESLNSPQNSIYSAIQKEKHKARKLQQVTTQSCLSRDINQDDSNLLDLIHKIVPIEQMNVTSQTNKTDLQNSKDKPVDDDDKWDVTSIITEQNDDNISETYTDEEVFNATVKELAKEIVSKKPTPSKENSCKILVDRLPLDILKQKQQFKVKDDVASKNVQKSIKTFWDTDFESDAECQPLPRSGVMNFKENHRKDAPHPEALKFQGISTMFSSKKSAASTSNISTFINNSVVQKFNNTTLRIRSHRTPKRKNQTRDEDAKSDIIEPLSKKLKTSESSSCTKSPKTTIHDKTNTAVQNKKHKTTEPKQQPNNHNKKSPKGKKQGSKTNKPNESIKSVKEKTPKKQTNNNKKDENDTKTKRNQKAVVEIEDETKKEIINSEPKKTNQRAKKSNNKKTDDTHIEEKPKKETSNKKTAPSKHKSNKQNKDLFENEQQIEKQSNNNKKDIVLDDDTKTKKLTNTNKKSTETKSQNKNLKTTKSTKKNVLKNNSSVNESTLTEDKNNVSRAIRSCRRSKLNETLDNSNLNGTMNRTLRSRQITLNGNLNNSCVNDTTLTKDNTKICKAVRSCQSPKRKETPDETLNVTMNRTLRSRQIDLSSTLNGNVTKAKLKVNNEKDSKSRLSNFSFSIPAENKAVGKLTKSRRFQAQDMASSDVSFSLTGNEFPTPKKTISAKSRLNSKAGKKENELIKSTPLKKFALQGKELFVSKNDSRPNRSRIPNKRYLIC